VRQLEQALNIVFERCCLLIWARETKQGEEKSKITINSDLVNQTIPNDFLCVDEEKNQTATQIGKVPASIAGNPWFVLFIISLLLVAILGWKNYLLKRVRQTEKNEQKQQNQPSYF
jgi:hypothetical protein